MRVLDITPAATLGYLLESSPFISLESKGIYVDLGKLESAEKFADFCDAAFQGGFYLTGLSYKNLSALLYSLDSVKAQFPRLRLSDGFAPLLPNREALYQGELQADPTQAEYDFTLKTDSRANFALGVSRSAAPESPRTVDEFVAVLWKKGIRFGLDMEAIKQGLATPANKFLKLVIAQALKPQPGADARLEHLISLEKDLRPQQTPDGGVDLRRYLCVFPQAKAQQVILRRIPPTPSQDGHDIYGHTIPAYVEGKDIALADLAGSGVVVTQVGNFQCLVAARSGFVSVNPQTGSISVTDEVINHTPVGIRTGHLSIEAENCLQFGGVSHGYSLEGRNLELKTGKIEGSVVSRQGDIKIGGDVVGGQVAALTGDIKVAGKVMAGSRLEAYGGTITVGLAENCLLIGRVVIAQKLVNANVIAEQVVIKEAEGTGIFAFGAKIERLIDRRSGQAGGGPDRGGSILAVPIIEPPHRPAEIIRRTIEALIKPLPEMEAQIEQIGNNDAVQTYLRALVTYQTAKNEEQAKKAKSVFMTLEEKVLPVVERWRALKDRRERLLEAKGKLDEEYAVWRSRIRRLEEELQGSMQFSVSSISDAQACLKLVADPRLPESFREMLFREPPLRKQFETLCLQIISSMGHGQAKQRVVPLLGSLKSSYQQMRMLLMETEDESPNSGLPIAGSERDQDQRREQRLTLLTPNEFHSFLIDPERKPPAGRLLLPVKVDEILEGYISDLSGLGVALLLDNRQRYLPVFYKGDKINLELTLGQVNLHLEMKVVVCQEAGRLVRLGGHFVNLPPALQSSLYKIKNSLEARLLGGAE